MCMCLEYTLWIMCVGFQLSRMWMSEWAAVLTQFAHSHTHSHIHVLSDKRQSVSFTLKLRTHIYDCLL